MRLQHPTYFKHHFCLGLLVNFIFHFEQNYGLLVKLIIVSNKEKIESLFAPWVNCINGHETTVFWNKNFLKTRRWKSRLWVIPALRKRFHQNIFPAFDI